MICSTGQFKGGYVDNYHFQRAFSKLRPEALRELSERLFGKEHKDP